MDMITTKEYARIRGCNETYINRLIRCGKIKSVTTTTDKNVKKNLIPLEQLTLEEQSKYLKEKGILASAISVDNAEQLESMSIEEREECAFWEKIINEWQTARNKRGVKSKLEVDELFITKMKLEYPELNISSSSLYRKYKCLRQGNLKGLIDKRGKVRKGVTKIDEFVWQVFLSFYLDQAQNPIRKCYEYTEMYLKSNAQEYVDDMPTYCTFTRHVKDDIAEAIKVLGREGEKAFDDRCAPYIKRTYDNMKANEYWIADNHTFDVMVQSDSGDKVYRLYLTAFMDARSGIFTGYYVTTAPSSQATIVALRKGILKYGIPDNLYLDNGREFLTFDLGGLGHRAKRNDERFNPKTIFERLGINMINALVRNAKAKIIERRFLDVKNGLSRLFTTYTGGSVAEKPEILKFELKKGNIPTDSFFTQCVGELLEYYFNYEDYDGAVSEDKGLRKIDVYNRNLPTVTRVASEEQLNLLLMRSTRAQKVTRRGVHLDVGGARIDYFNNEMLMQLLNKQVYLRYDPEDLSSVRLYDLEDRYIMTVESDNEAVLEYGASKADVKQAMSKTRQFKKAAKETLKGSVLNEIGRSTALELVLKKAKENKQSEVEQPSIEHIALLSEEEPLLHQFPLPDLERMNENALKRKGGKDYA